ncbi:hypothetical protein K431DRAFT_154895 [Polychaeton citri CBS 116435]|uniref:Transcription factor domain-containing protein n=1 Tax=Polychaeton citri CBS 116435 TaxID=1314669 RepID=A0A9P4UQ87_9PEZI|nr:hypothetical protein K431DRAFT_154895 [Polychaeton citri CBS 116435]
MDYYQEESRKWQSYTQPEPGRPNFDYADATGFWTDSSLSQSPSQWVTSSMDSSNSPSNTSSGSGIWTGVSVAQRQQRRAPMQTGCIPCLAAKRPCSPSNPGCQLALSDDWYLNGSTGRRQDGQHADNFAIVRRDNSLSLFQPETAWPRRTWRERHSLNFFVNFSAPQMAGFFESNFWLRSVVQASYSEPAIMHGLIAIGSLHEGILQRAFADERRKSQAIDFALKQCNRAISCLTNGEDTGEQGGNGRITKRGAKDARQPPSFRVLLTACVLFTCFESMQGRCDSAVQHAMQGRRLLESSSRPHLMTMDLEEDAIEDMRALIDRLEAQAVSLVDKGKRPQVDMTSRTQPLPPITRIHSIDHAQHSLHHAMNSIMRFMQAFHPSAPRDHIAMTMAEKHLRYSPWLVGWAKAFESFLASSPEHHVENLSNIDQKRCLVIKTNHLVCTMLASVDQSVGPSAYDAYEDSFRQIVELAREVLSSFSCPPLPTLKPGSPGTPYLSFSLWVTDPLWMVISRCRSPSVRQAAFTLLSQHPRQEGIWHAGPAAQPPHAKRANAPKPIQREGTSPGSGVQGQGIGSDTVLSSRSSGSDADASASEGASSPDTSRQSRSTTAAASSVGGSSNEQIPEPQMGEVPKNISEAPLMGNMKIRGEWLDLQAYSQVSQHSQ